MPEDYSGNAGRKNKYKQHQHNDFYHLVYGFWITIFVGIINFIFLYPDYHFLSLLVLSAWLSLVATYELYSRDLAVHVAPIIGLLFCIAILAYTFVGPNLPAETEIHGWLLPGHDPDIQNNCKLPSDGLSFVLGTNLAWVSANKPISYVFGINKTPLIAAVRDGDKLAFDVDIFDDSGRLAVRIEKNEFHLVPGEYSYREDRSADRTTLIVYDRNGAELLQIKYANPWTVLIYGVFNSVDGTKAIVTSNSIILPGIPNLFFAHNCARGGLRIKRDASGNTIIE